MLRTLATAVVVAALLPAGASAQAAKPATTTVKVTAGSPTEFRFKLSKTVVRRGVVVLRVTNSGALPHDFKIAGKRTPLLQPGKSRTLRVVFAKRGRYAYRCTVPGHAAAGMRGSIRVR